MLTIDVRPIGPRDSAVGFASVNSFFHRLTGVHMTLYLITDWLSLLPVAICFAFAIAGLVQWIKRRHILRVDADILVLGLFYIAVMAIYILFEYVVVNRRPVLIMGYLEASYPSSTTMLVLTVMPTAALMLKKRIKNLRFNRLALIVIRLFTLFMVLGRLLSGVHWLSDIVAGILISLSLVQFFVHLKSLTDA